MRAQPKGMFQRFTDRARRAVHLAQEEARLLRHDYVGTEHLLLGLLYEGTGVAAKALESLGISREDVRGQVEEIIGHGQGSPAGHIPFTRRAKKVLELSLREALALGHHYIGTEHLLLGLLRQEEGAAAQVLRNLGLSLPRFREEVLAYLTGERPVVEGITALPAAPPDESLRRAQEVDHLRELPPEAPRPGDWDGGPRETPSVRRGPLGRLGGWLRWLLGG